MIRARGLTKRFGSLTAVDRLDLEVGRSELYAVLGPNAAGKTTAIKMVVGLLRPDEGELVVGGVDMSRDPLSAKRQLAYVPDIPFLYDKLTPREFLHFTTELYELNERQAAADRQRWAELFGLGPYLDELIENLSHGTRQRVVIAGALLHRPRVLVLDEPMVGLDPHFARVLKDVLRAAVAEGMTILLSSHQLAIAEELADRIGILHRGRLVAETTPGELARAGAPGTALEHIFLNLTEEAGAAADREGAR